MTIVALQAWCDYVTEDEYRQQLTRTARPASPTTPTGSPAPGPFPGHSADAVEEALTAFRRSATFRVQEYAVLDDGRRLPLGDERGFATSAHTAGRAEPGWRFLTPEGIESDVLATVLPDEDTGEDHPWQWLADQARAHGVAASPEQLRRLPYQVVLSSRLRTRLREVR